MAIVFQEDRYQPLKSTLSRLLTRKFYPCSMLTIKGIFSIDTLTVQIYIALELFSIF